MTRKKNGKLHVSPSPRPAKPYDQMNARGLAEATKEFDREFVAETFRPLTPAQRAMHRRAKRRGRKRIGEGARRVLITVEGGLLAKADAYAKRHKMNRSQLIAAGLRTIISPKAA